MNRNIRTDLALEMKEHINVMPMDGVHLLVKRDKEYDIKETKIVIENQKGVSKMGKPIGSYVTIESDDYLRADVGFYEPMVKALSRNLNRLIGKSRRILVVGLGNRQVTADSLGPLVVDNLYITRNMTCDSVCSISFDGVSGGSHKNSDNLIFANERGLEISAIAPGVMAQTGMESKEIIKGIIKENRPQVIIAVDALAAREAKRLYKAIQVSDAGIEPGSGIGNSQAALNEETLGVKVIGVGVPTVVSVPTLIADTMTNMIKEMKESGRYSEKYGNPLSNDELYEQAKKYADPFLSDMYVTPRNVDEMVKRISYTISEAINRLYFFETEKDDIETEKDDIETEKDDIEIEKEEIDNEKDNAKKGWIKA